MYPITTNRIYVNSAWRTEGANMYLKLQHLVFGCAWSGWIGIIIVIASYELDMAGMPEMTGIAGP